MKTGQTSPRLPINEKLFVLRWLFYCIALLVLGFSGMLVFRRPPAKAGRVSHLPASAAARLAIAKNYGQLPLRFEANLGQTDRSAEFLSRGNGYSLFLTPTESVFVLRQPPTKTSASQSAPAAVLRMKLLGANRASRARALERLSGASNYFIGNDPKKWRTDVPNYAKVQFENVYPGVNLVYYGNQSQLEYDFVVAPGADPSVIQLGFRGAQHVTVDSQGDLRISTLGREIRWRKPVIYQEISGAKKAVEGRYIQHGNNRVGFELASYDSHRPLVIDPQLIYSTYLGGSSSDTAFAIAADSAGDAYVTGLTGSSDFPTASPFQSALASSGSSNAFITKLNATGDGVIYSTYLGGSGGGLLSEGDWGSGIAVDSAGDAYVTGFTFSQDFPTTAGAFQTAAPGSGVAWVAKLNAAGSALVYSTYLGGNNPGAYQSAPLIAIDASGNAYVTGTTYASNFPTVNSVQGTYGGAGDCFVSKLNPAASGLIYSTYLGGNDQDICSGIAVNSSGEAYVSGETLSTDFQFTVSLGKSGFMGKSGGFVVKLINSGTGIAFSTQLGGTSGNSGAVGGGAIALDSAQNVYLAGTTTSTDLPVTLNAYQGTFGGGTSDAYVMKLDSAGANILFASYLGGSGGEGCSGIALDSAGRIYVAGNTTSPNFPHKNALQIGFSGGIDDAFVAEFDPSSTGSGTLVFSTYMGGSLAETPFGVALDPSGNLYVAGNTGSPDFPITTGALQTSFKGGANDGWVAKFAGSGGTQQPANVNSLSGSAQIAMVGAPAPAPFSATVTDSSGNGVPNQTVTFTGPSSGASGSFAGGGTTSTATTNSSGVATSAAFTANTTAGNYTVTATVAGVSGSASFALTNVDFAVSPASSASLHVAPGSSATVAVNLVTAPAGAALPVDVNYSCSVQTSLTGVTCALNPAKTAAGGTSGSTTVTISASSSALAALHPSSSFPRAWLAMAFGIVGVCVTGRRKGPRRGGRVLLAFLGLALWFGAVACSSPLIPPNPQPKSGSGSVSVTAAAGSLSRSTTVSFTVQ